MSEEQQNDDLQALPQDPAPAPVVDTPPAEPEAPQPDAAQPPIPQPEDTQAEEPKAEEPKAEEPKPAPQQQQQQRPPRGERPPKDRQQQQQQQQRGAKAPNRGPNDRPQDNRRGEPRPDRRPDRRPDGPIEIEYDKLVADSLYLDNQAHVLVARLRDLDAGTRSQLRRLYGAVRRACRAPEAERQHQFVMLRARLAYTIARHGLRSLDPLEKLLLQVTRRNESRGYDRFRDLFEAIIAYNE